MTNNDELERERLCRCDRCGIPKPPDRFRASLPYWNKWCIRCEASPTGEFPIPETDEHRRQP
ncbi:protein NinD [Pantoea sp. PGP6]